MRNENDSEKKEDEARQFFLNLLPPPMKTDTENRMAKPKAHRQYLQQNYRKRHPQELQKMNRYG